jgi:hypothetical protein
VALDKGSLFAECPLDWHSAKGSPAGPFVSSFAECICRHSAKVDSLLSVKATALRKEALPVPRCAFFAECYDLDTRQSISLPSVTLDKVTRLPLFYLFLLFHPNKQNIYHIIITYTSQNHHIHNRDHIFYKKTQISQVFHKHVYVHTKFHQHRYYQL